MFRRAIDILESPNGFNALMHTGKIILTAWAMSGRDMPTDKGEIHDLTLYWTFLLKTQAPLVVLDDFEKQPKTLLTTDLLNDWNGWHELFSPRKTTRIRCNWRISQGV